MKTRKILSVMAALALTASLTGCNVPNLFKVVSTEPSEQENSTVSATEEESDELVPKITANPSASGSSGAAYDGFIAGDKTKEAVDIADEPVKNDIAFEDDVEMYAEPFYDDDEVYAEAPTEEAPATAAPAPGYYDDVYEITDDDFYKIKPQAGLLTASEWNDNDNWGFFSNLINNDKIAIPSEYGLDPTQRVAVTVTDKSKNPVVNATVKGFAESGSLIWSAVTDKNGVAYLFNGDKILDLEIESQGKTVTSTLRTDCIQPYSDEQTVIKISDSKIGVIFDGESKNYAQNEIMFVVDTTGSMGDELMFLQSEFTAIAEEIGTQDTKFSINFYRDDGDDYTTKRYPFSSNIEEINKKLNSEYATGGGDLPEAVAEILDETINDGGWSNESVKLMFLIFDAPPHNGKEQMLESAVKKAAEKGIRIIPVVSSNSDRNTELFGRSAAIMTGGTYVFLTDDSGIGHSHLEPIIGEHKVEKLYDIIIRVINDYKQVNAAPVPEKSEVSELSEIISSKEVSEIVDRTVTEQITTDTALEKFYEDDENEYYYGSIKSEYVIVKYADGNTETVKEALKAGRIAIGDLDKFGISYIKEPV